MNRKSLNLILIGVFLISVRFLITIGIVRLDVSSDVIGFILIICGMQGFRTLNSLSKKAFVVSWLGLIGAIVSQVINSLSWPSDIASTMYSISIGISVIFSIYFTYYFIEALMLEAKVQDKQAVTRNYQIMWFVLAAVIFAHYFIFMSSVSVQSTVVEVIVVIIAMYTCLNIKNSAKQLM